MIYFVCTCGLCLQVIGEELESQCLVGTASDFYPDRYPCPAENCGEKMVYAAVLDKAAPMTVVNLSANEAFSAFMGLGLPQERDCGVTAVMQLFEKQRVVKVDATQVPGANRCVLHSLLFDDGRRLWLGSCPEGAVVYRLAMPREYYAEVTARG